MLEALVRIFEDESATDEVRKYALEQLVPKIGLKGHLLDAVMNAYKNKEETRCAIFEDLSLEPDEWNVYWHQKVRPALEPESETQEQPEEKASSSCDEDCRPPKTLYETLDDENDLEEAAAANSEANGRTDDAAATAEEVVPRSPALSTEKSMITQGNKTSLLEVVRADDYEAAFDAFKSGRVVHYSDTLESEDADSFSLVKEWLDRLSDEDRLSKLVTVAIEGIKENATIVGEAKGKAKGDQTTVVVRMCMHDMRVLKEVVTAIESDEGDRRLQCRKLLAQLCPKGDDPRPQCRAGLETTILLEGLGEKYKHVSRFVFEPIIRYVRDSKSKYQGDQAWRLEDSELKTMEAIRGTANTEMKELHFLMRELSIGRDDEQTEALPEVSGATAAATARSLKDMGEELLAAAEEGDERALKALLGIANKRPKEERTEFLGTKNQGKFTALHNTANYGKSRCMEMLIKAGADIDRCDNYAGWTPLIMAARYGQSGCILVLLAHGANLNHADNQTMTALDRAKEWQRKSCIPLLQEAEALQTAEKDVVAWATARLGRSADEKEADEEKQHTYDGNEDNEELRYALLNAAEEGDENTIKNLIELENVDLMVRNINRWTALHNTANFGHHECMRLLIMAGADFENNDNYPKWTPLFTAARYGKEQCIMVLLAFGADTQHKDGTGHMALDRAREWKRTTCVKILEHARDMGQEEASQWATEELGWELHSIEAVRESLARTSSSPSMHSIEAFRGSMARTSSYPLMHTKSP